MRNPLRAISLLALVGALGLVWLDVGRRETARQAAALALIAEDHCGVCHRAIGDWDALAPPELMSDVGALKRLMTEAAALEMPPSPWRRARLAEHLEAF